MASVTRVPVLVVGGGIGGLATAIALARADRPVHVIEQAPAFAEIGAGLQLGPNATRVLDRLGVLPRVIETGVLPRRMTWMDALSGNFLTSLELGDTIRNAYGHPYIVMHRSDLLDALLVACTNHAHITLETDRMVRAVEDLGDGARVRCVDGSVYEADLLIGADGLNSTVRKLLADDAPCPSHYVAYRGTAPAEEVTAHSGPEDVMLWSGPELHLVQYPVRGGELYNQVAVFRSADYRPNDDSWGTPDELDARFSITCDFVQRALRSIRRDRRWSMTDRPPIAVWTRNRIALLGDAAHPMLQYLAQGACQALEDAACLADVLDGPGATMECALTLYQERRAMRAARVQMSARFFGDIIHANGVPALVRDTMLRARGAADYSMVDWLYR